jgi:hypothetical protein
MKIYDSPQNLVLLVNTSPEEDSAIGAELGEMGCRKPGLRIVGYEMGRKERYVFETRFCEDLAQFYGHQGRTYISKED